tara:strand:- start:694 stop:1584 length:891 start_codon:yes stop_codon:yes gene_type:complete
MKKSLTIFHLIWGIFLHGQDDLLDIFDNVKEEPVLVESAFKGTRVANAQSLEIPKPKILQFMIQHRFGSIENGFYDLFGTDYAMIRYDFHYGYNDRISFGVGRSSFDKIYDIFLKAKLARQTKGEGSFPLSILIYSDVGVETMRKSEDYASVNNNFLNRLIYINQFIIGRKINRKLSLEVLPTSIYRNLVPSDDFNHQQFSFGLAGRYKLTPMFSINADYFYPIGSRNDNYKKSFAIGFDYETGGHVFQVMISNAQGSYENTFIESANGDISKNRLYLGFNISRAFSLKSSNSDNW